MLHRRDRAARLADVAGIATAPARQRALARAAASMIVVGTDLVYLPEFAGRLAPRFIERAYTTAEATYASEHYDRVPPLAARWAAKEAAYKAFSALVAKLGVAGGGLACFRQYEVLPAPGTVVPELRLGGRAAALVAEMRSRGAVDVSLSLTHERDYASAFVVIAFFPTEIEPRGARA
jgi:phosphopantetheine--protein transferase-like protein